MKKFILFFITLMIPILVSAQPDDCNNFPCGDAAPWSTGVEVTVQSNFCPQCEWEITFNWRVVTCNNTTRLQINMTKIEGKDVECYQNSPCNWDNLTELERYEDAYEAFMEWTLSGPAGTLFGYAEYVEYTNGQCWKFNYESGPFGGWSWERCPTSACCIWIYQREYDPISHESTLSDPVLIEPGFLECNPFIGPFTTNYCYSFCGLMAPHINLKTPNTELITVLENPEIYPNPAKDEIRVTVNFAQENNYSIVITDISGAVVKQIDFSANVSNPNIDISNLANGTYYCQVRIKNNYVIYSDRFIIAR
jgi:hypothetical protein